MGIPILTALRAARLGRQALGELARRNGPSTDAELAATSILVHQRVMADIDEVLAQHGVHAFVMRDMEKAKAQGLSVIDGREHDLRRCDLCGMWQGGAMHQDARYGAVLAEHGVHAFVGEVDYRACAVCGLWRDSRVHKAR
ncbi:MAG: hypothetical protein HY263_01075 [Chloroflexi bacterium]|nr:hypothetical protein [Chloroflexota bacterium]